MQRPSWNNYFLNIAFLASQRSHDIHTQHGCVITDQDNRILSIGYNGFPRGGKDDELPTNRPASNSIEDYNNSKYPWMFHAEENAVANCPIRPDGATAYVTGQCCNHCIYTLWQHGIKKVVMANRHGSALLNDETKKFFDEFVQTTGIEISYVDTDLSLLKKTYDKFYELDDKAITQTI